MADDCLIKRWDIVTGKELPLPEGYTAQTTMVTAVDGKHLIVSDHKGQVDFWDVKTGRLAKQLQPSHLSGINCLAQSADGRWLAAGRTSQDVRIFDLSTGKVVRDIALGDDSDAKWGDQVLRVAFSSDGKVLFTGSNQTGVTAWEIASGKKLWRTPAGAGMFAADPAGRWLAIIGNYEQKPVSWVILNPATGEVRFRIKVAEASIPGQISLPYLLPLYISDLTATPDGTRLITAHYDGTARVWSPETGKELAVLKHSPQGPGNLAVSADGKWLASTGMGNFVYIYDLAAAKEVVILMGNNSASNQLGFTHDGRGLITSADLAPLLWDLAPKDLPAVDGPADALWNTLTGDDAAKAYRLQWALIRKPAVAVRLLTERFKVADWEFDRPLFDKTVANLDSPRFAVREAAEKALAAAGERLPGGWLKNALADTKSEEVRTRLDRVLAGRAKQPDLAARRVSRAVQVLELAGTAETTALLKTWAKATAGSVLADEAMAALGRLGR